MAALPESGGLEHPPTPRLAEVGSPDWAPARGWSKGDGGPRAVLTASQCASHHGSVEVRGQGSTTQEGLELVVGGEVGGSGWHSHHPGGVYRLAKILQSSQTSQGSLIPLSQPTLGVRGRNEGIRGGKPQNWGAHRVAGRPLHRVLVPSCRTIFTKASWSCRHEPKRRKDEMNKACGRAGPGWALPMPSLLPRSPLGLYTCNSLFDSALGVWKE